jgi:hypothetical protein
MDHDAGFTTVQRNKRKDGRSPTSPSEENLQQPTKKSHVTDADADDDRTTMGEPSDVEMVHQPEIPAHANRFDLLEHQVPADHNAMGSGIDTATQHSLLANNAEPHISPEVYRAVDELIQLYQTEDPQKKVKLMGVMQRLLTQEKEIQHLRQQLKTPRPAVPTRAPAPNPQRRPTFADAVRKSKSPLDAALRMMEAEADKEKKKEMAAKILRGEHPTGKGRLDAAKAVHRLPAKDQALSYDSFRRRKEELETRWFSGVTRMSYRKFREALRAIMDSETVQSIRRMEFIGRRVVEFTMVKAVAEKVTKAMTDNGHSHLQDFNPLSADHIRRAGLTDQQRQEFAVTAAKERVARMLAETTDFALALHKLDCLPADFPREEAIARAKEIAKKGKGVARAGAGNLAQ